MRQDHHTKANNGVLRADHLAWTDGHREPYIDFDYDSIDGKQSHADASGMASEALAKVIAWCWETRAHQGLNSPFRRFMVLSRAIQPQLFEGKSYKDIADELGCTKQAISTILEKLSKSFGVHLRERSDTACNHMRSARMKQKDANGKVLGRHIKPRAAVATRGA